MKPPAMHFEDRLRRLERENRWLKRVSGAVLALVAVAGLMSAAFPETTRTLCKTIWAERFILKDAHMNDRILLDAYSYETPRMIVKDEKGRTVTELAFGQNGRTTITTRNAAGKASEPMVLWGPRPDQPLERDDGVLF